MASVLVQNKKRDRTGSFLQSDQGAIALLMTQPSNAADQANWITIGINVTESGLVDSSYSKTGQGFRRFAKGYLLPLKQADLG